MCMRMYMHLKSGMIIVVNIGEVGGRQTIQTGGGQRGPQ